MIWLLSPIITQCTYYTFEKHILHFNLFFQTFFDQTDGDWQQIGSIKKKGPVLLLGFLQLEFVFWGSVG